MVSPLLLNVALHGMEQAAGVRYQTSGLQAGVIALGSPTAIRYADDLVALCHTRDEAEQVKARLAEWLAPTGLVFNEDKTRVFTLDDGLRLPGVHRPPTVRQAADQTEQGGTETDPGTAPHRDACPARGQRIRGREKSQPHHQGLGRLLPDGGVQQDLSSAGRVYVEARLQVGQT